MCVPFPYIYKKDVRICDYIIKIPPSLFSFTASLKNKFLNPICPNKQFIAKRNPLCNNMLKALS